MRRLRPAASALVVVVLVAACGGGAAPPRPEPRAKAPTVAWRWDAPPGANVGAPGVDGGDVAVTVGRRAVVLLRGGRERWQVTHVGVRDVAPLVSGSLVAVPTDVGLVALDRASGSARWEARLEDRAATPVRAGGRLVTALWDGALVAVDLRDGREVWRVPTPGKALAPPVTSGGTVVGGGDAGLVAAEAGTGAERWRVELPPGTSAPVVAGTVVVVVAGDRTARAFDVDTGAERWRVAVRGPGSPEVPPAATVDGDVVVATATGSVARLDATTGRVRWATAGGVGAWRGGPAVGRGGTTAVALGLDLVALLHPRRSPRVLDPPGGVSGIARTAEGELLVATTHARSSALLAYRGW